MNIRGEAAGDEAHVRTVHSQAFRHHADQVVALVDDLRTAVTAHDGLSLVAEIDGEIVGNVMFTRGWVDAPSRLVEVQVLSPLGVLPTHQRQGIGSALVRHGLAAMQQREAVAVFLEGSPLYYSRLGFVSASAQGFGAPSVRIPDAAFQVHLLPAHKQWMTGALVYAEAFWRHDAVGLRDKPDTPA